MGRHPGDLSLRPTTKTENEIYTRASAFHIMQRTERTWTVQSVSSASDCDVFVSFCGLHVTITPTPSLPPSRRTSRHASERNSVCRLRRCLTNTIGHSRTPPAPHAQGQCPSRGQRGAGQAVGGFLRPTPRRQVCSLSCGATPSHMHATYSSHHTHIHSAGRPPQCPHGAESIREAHIPKAQVKHRSAVPAGGTGNGNGATPPGASVMKRDLQSRRGGAQGEYMDVTGGDAGM